MMGSLSRQRQGARWWSEGKKFLQTRLHPVANGVN
jgi:hypothetical protein